MLHEIEELICAVSESLSLNSSAISASDNFLSLGGDSLAAMFVAEQLADKGLILDPLDLISDATLKELVLQIENSGIKID